MFVPGKTTTLKICRSEMGKAKHANSKRDPTEKCSVEPDQTIRIPRFHKCSILYLLRTPNWFQQSQSWELCSLSSQSAVIWLFTLFHLFSQPLTWYTLSTAVSVNGGCAQSRMAVGIRKTTHCWGSRNCCGPKNILPTCVTSNKMCRQIDFVLRYYYECFWRQVKHTRDVMPDAKPEVLIMVIGAASGISRLLCGKISDLPGMNRVRMQVCTRRFD